MPTTQWMKLEETAQITGGTVSVFTNALLMYLIVAKSPPKLGTYKWLMLYTSSFEFFYAFVNLFAAPSVHTFGSAFIVFQDMRNFWLDHQTAQVLVCLYCSCFGFSMAIFGGHFIYRYGAVDIDFRQKYLSGAKQALLYIFPFLYGILWGVICWLYYGETYERTEYLRDTMLENYRLNISDCAYISAHFWPYDENGNVFPDQDSWLGIGVMWVILGSSMFSVIYFAIRCYRWLTLKLKHIESISESMKSLQKQLFNALLIQSSIPLFLMYMPAGMVFFFPMLNTELNLKYPFIGITIAIYPAIDPLPTILIIQSYRRGCLDLLRKITCRRRKQIDISNHSNAFGTNPKRQSSFSFFALLTEEWYEFEHDTQDVCGIVSIVTNLFLMYLILSKSPKALGSYKWLMLYTTLFELTYALVNLFAGSSVRTFGSAFIVFHKSRHGHDVTELLAVTYCACYGFSLAIIASHFIYRYGAVDLDFRRKYISGAKQLFLYIVPSLTGSVWGLICWVYCGETPERTNYLGNKLMDNYRLKIEDIGYISAHYWPIDENGNTYPEFDSFFGTALMFIIVGTSIGSVLYFGIGCYCWISKKLEMVETQSEHIKSLQKQLFHALVVQSAIPFILMYVPIGMAFLFPMLNIELNLKYPFIGLTIAIYPAIDPLPSILIIASYRRGCVDILRSLKCWRKSTVTGNTTRVDSVMMFTIS